MRSVILLVTALGAGGCNQLFGLDPGSGGDDDVPPGDGGPPDAARTFGVPVEITVGAIPNALEAVQLDQLAGRELAVPCAGSNELAVVRCEDRSCGVVVYVTGTTPVAVASLDIDRDNTVDLAVAALNSNSVLLYTNNSGGLDNGGTITFTLPAKIAAGRFAGGDDLPDLVVTAQSSVGLYTFPGNGAGGFGAPVPTGQTEQITAMLAAQLVGESETELVISDSVKVHLLLPSSGGQFTDTGTSLAGSGDALAAADVNSDGLPDLLVAHGDGTVDLLRGLGDGNFAASSVISVGAGLHALATGDADGDGNRDDLAVATRDVNGGLGDVRLFLGGTDGQLLPGPVLPVAGVNALAFADVDGDDRDDVAMAIATRNLVAIAFAD